MTNSTAGVLFDVDGTLVDTNYLHTLAWSRGFASVGQWAPMNAIHRLVGMGSDNLVPSLFGHEMPGAPEAKSRHYSELYGEVRAFDGAAELLAQIHQAGLTVVLATSSGTDDLEVSTRALCKAVGYDCMVNVDAVTNREDVKKSKPAPDIFLAALKSGNVDPSRALVVGDSVWDIQAARAAGLGCIAVESGGFSKHELSEAGALQVYRDVAELGKQLFTSPLSSILPRR